MGSMTLNRPREIAMITSTINVSAFIEIFDSFLLLSIDNCFCDDKVLFQDDNASCQRTNAIIVFLDGKHMKINDMTVNS